MSLVIDTATYRRDLKWPLGNGYSRRPTSGPSSIIIHTTNGNKGSTFANEAAFLRDNSAVGPAGETPSAQVAREKRRVSAGYLIGKQGQVAQIIPDHLAAWHSGACKPGFSNDASLGIECHLTVGEAWPPAMRAALAALVQMKVAAYQMDMHRVETHRAVALPPGRKIDPSGWTDADFYAWRAQLTAAPVPVRASPPAPPASVPTPPQFHGIILTHVYQIDQIRQALSWGGYTALKVVTGWGLEHGWTDMSRAAVARLAGTLVVRSVAGDPSYAGGSVALPIPDTLLAEFAPWVAVAPDCWLEIGNEPNIPEWATNDKAIWDYRYNLAAALPRLRAAFPRAKLIAPGLLIDAQAATPSYLRWLGICGDVFRQYDAVAIHAYEHDAFVAGERAHGSTNQFQAIAQAYPPVTGNLPLILSEYGINDEATAEVVKGRRYAALVRGRASTPPLPTTTVGYLAYHLCAKDDIHPSYSLHRLGHEAYGKEIRQR